MSRNSIGTAVGVALLLVGAVFLALRPQETTTTVDDGPELELPEDGSAIVSTLYAPGGVTLFGVHVIDPTHEIGVRFLSGPDCAAALDSEDPWPSPAPDCQGPPGLTGTVGGTGITSTGESIVEVRFVVSRDCFESLARGMEWPPAGDACG